MLKLILISMIPTSSGQIKCLRLNYQLFNPAEANRSNILRFICKLKNEEILISLFQFCNSEIIKVLKIKKDWGIEHNYDISKLVLSSLTKSQQNRYVFTWGFLIECFVAACDRLASISPIKIRLLSLQWFSYHRSFSFFRRAILHIFKYRDVYSEDEIKQEVLTDIQTYLWDTNLSENGLDF